MFCRPLNSSVPRLYFPLSCDNKQFRNPGYLKKCFELFERLPLAYERQGIIRKSMSRIRKNRLSHIAMFLGFCAALAWCSAESVYQEKPPSRDGTGRLYMGREIAHTVSSHAISWLERPDRVDEEHPAAAVEHLGLRADDVVADVGAGSGYFTFLMAAQVPQGKVIAVDIQQEMLDFIANKASRDGVSNVETTQCTPQDANLPAGGVNLVLMVDAYHEFTHPREMMESILRSLAPDGRVILLEYRGEHPSVPIKPLHKMTVKQVTREMEAVGLRLDKVLDFLPTQHFLIFRKSEKELQE